MKVFLGTGTVGKKRERLMHFSHQIVPEETTTKLAIRQEIISSFSLYISN